MTPVLSPGPDLASSPDLAPRPVLALDDVRFGWPGGFALAVPRFTLAAGERVFLAGPSGSGKSTLLALMTGILAPQSGTVSVLGEAMTALSARRRDRLRAEGFGIVFQMFNLLPFASVLDNILLPLRFAPQRRARAGGRSGARAEALRLMEGLGLEAGLAARPARTLSTGQQQRAAVARALIGRPPILIADEPTSALDAAAQARFLALLSEQAGAAGAALVMVSHDERLTDGFDRVVALADLVRADGPPC